MGRYLDKGGKASDPTKAAVDPTTAKPVTNGARDVWIQLNALATGLNISYLVEQIGMFSIAVGIGLALAGLGFLVFLYGPPRAPREALAPAGATSSPAAT